MQLMLSTEEIQAAPKAVKDWFLAHMGITTAIANKPEKLKAIKEEPSEKNKTSDFAEEDIKDIELTEAPPKKGGVDFKKLGEKLAKASEIPDRSTVMAKAKELIDANNTAGLKKALRKVGIPTVGHCPDDKLADLLTALSVAE